MSYEEFVQVRIALLLLLKEVVSSPEWFKRSRYRVRDINTCLRRFLDVAEAALGESSVKIIF